MLPTRELTLKMRGSGGGVEEEVEVEEVEGAERASSRFGSRACASSIGPNALVSKTARSEGCVTLSSVSLAGGGRISTTLKSRATGTFRSYTARAAIEDGLLTSRSTI